MMSEDSDYTSDVNFPLQHQHNMSAHQYGADHSVVDNDVSWHQHHHHHQQQPYYRADAAGYYGNDAATPQSRAGRYGDGYYDDRVAGGYGGDYYRGYEHGDERSWSSRHPGGGYRDGGGWYRAQQQRYRPERSDSESEPLSYNSRPQSYYTDRFSIYLAASQPRSPFSRSLARSFVHYKLLLHHIFYLVA